MKIVILSGGSGNDALIKGLEKFVNNDADLEVKVIVNAYDNGKSTGVCRAITDTLGVSDIRKNHSRMYEAKHKDNLDQNILEFYNKRYNFSDSGKDVKSQIFDLLDKWQIAEYKGYVERFFENQKAKNFKFNDFSVSNIVYAEMYKEIGYEKTNKHFCDKIGIDDFVVLNSFDNLFIKALTESGHVIEDEGETVFWNNSEDKIVKTIYDVKTHYGLNKRAIKLVQEADLVVISTGTFWSSIQPTIEYLNFYKYINSSKAKKVWVINNEEDGDSFGVSSLDFIKFMEQTGLDLSEFTILLNKDAKETLKKKNEKYRFVEKSMGNIKGKHNGDKYARALLQVYYDLEDKEDYDKIIFDFDDTIWARKKVEKLENVSMENIKLINDKLYDKAIIVSGNSFDSIKEKLEKVYDRIDKIKVDIWADANSTLFKNGKIADFIEDFVISEKAKPIIDRFVNKFKLNVKVVGVKPVNYKIKPLSSLEREMAVELLNIKSKNLFKANITGTTTVDILSCKNDKSVIFDHCNLNGQKTLFIGDELKFGNDVEISKRCSKTLEVKNVFETNLILKLLIGDKL